jgi:exo-beta-1,3-glucanase (GH17 family)/cellulose synthase/poly-beta-1,6-N-acetylglucosamine synthase-like glycosyltransferase
MSGFADLQSCPGRAQGTGSGNPLQPHSVTSMRLAAVVALIACVHAGLWALSGQQALAPDVSGPLASVSYAPFADVDHPDRGARPTAAQIRADLKAIAPHTRAIRTYSSTGGAELVPSIADEFDLKVTVGAWIDKHQDRNERELRAATELAKKNGNVDGLVVGNETIYRGEQTVEALIKLIQRTKREVQVPVTTGEIWHVWIEHPELASSVDFIAAHILPYWEGFSDSQAVDQAILIYDKLRQTFPGKRIVIAEFGWPSGGYNLKNATPGPMQQAVVLRDFVSHAEALGIDYNIVEAIDQPWKVFEGSVGPYWGLFNAARQDKFPWTGPIVDRDHGKIGAVAVLIGFLLSLPILTAAAVTRSQAAVLAISVHVIGAWCATVFAYWKAHYFVPGAAFALGLGVVLLAVLAVIALARMEEIAAIAFGPKPRRLLAGLPVGPAGFAPKVSIHIPACREPPEMLKLTLDAVSRLNYPNFECILVINNTSDPALWRPVEDHCAELGPRFKFVNAERLAGFKAGALRLALVHAAADAEIIGVLDADYAVHPDWLKDLVPSFADSRVGLIQAPQDHRDADRSLMHHLMNGEYAGFFDVGMVQRNENNAIIVHGTMCLIRRTAFETAGGWSSDTICEDTDLGLSILEHGWRALYTNRRYGWGLLPDSFEAFKKQRYRWASGGAQILKKHWRRFLPGGSVLTREQRREFVIGWLNWLGAETVGVTVALLNLIWVPIVAFVGIAIPDTILTLPIIAAFAVSMVHFVAVYRMRVAVPPGQMVGAMFAAMSVQWTVARAVGDGIIKSRLPFVRTAKGGGQRLNREFEAFWEAVIGGLLVVSAVVVVATNSQQIHEIYVFAVVLVLQSLPFLSAVAIAAVDGTQFNDFAYWRRLDTRLAEFLPHRPVMAKASTPAEKPIDPRS